MKIIVCLIGKIFRDALYSVLSGIAEDFLCWCFEFAKNVVTNEVVNDIFRWCFEFFLSLL